MNDEEREQWVDNDPGLYSWWRSTRPRVSKREFVRRNRADIDRAIVGVLGEPPTGGSREASRERAERLVYGRGVR